MIVALFIISTFVIPPERVHAYLDPGSGSYMLQMVLGLLLGSVVSIKIYGKKIRSFIKSKIGGKKEDLTQ